MTPSSLRELEAQIEEMEAVARSASPEQAAQLQQAIQAAKQTAEMLRDMLPAIEEGRARRKPVPKELQTFFTPEPPATVPAWLPDSLVRSEVTEQMLRCPPGSKVYMFDRSVSCSIPGIPGQALSVGNGLSLGFSTSGSLEHQRFFERDCCRWSIDYHLNGKRAQVGFYRDTEPQEFRRDGLHTTFNLDGVIRLQGWWRDGVQEGWTKNWEDDGYPSGATLYEGGRVVEEIFGDFSRKLR